MSSKFMSGSFNRAEEDVELGMNLGASGYLSKPVSMSQLREMVTSFLG